MPATSCSSTAAAGHAWTSTHCAAPKYRRRYIEASRFGEVNTYYHLDIIASHVDELLRSLGARPLPRVIAVVQAHHAAVVRDGVRDGELRKENWRPFEGGHYRLPSLRYNLREFDPVASEGEIHLGPGWHLLTHGALFDVAGTLLSAQTRPTMPA